MVTKFRKKVGRRIRNARMGRNWRQEDLAELIGKTPAYIGMLERGERSASEFPRHTHSLFQFFSCTI